MAATDSILDAKNVTIRFGGLTAVSDFNLSIRPHELVGLIGPNGAGKTTIFNMLTGVYKPTEGEIIVGGTSTRDFKPYQITALGVARTFQNIRLFKELTVLENVKIGGHIHYKYSATSAVLQTNRFHDAEETAHREAMELLAIFGLETRAHNYAKNLPYGDQRRLEIARALAARPKLLLLDEPAAGLNDRETLDLMETIHSIRDRFDIAILLIEHNMELVMGICERIIVVNFGKTIAQGAPEAIRANPVVIEAYLGEPAEALEQ
ncbi:MAG: branched-chain amino acid transport system ATP-binding protein [Acidobacteriota bacterium]|jgi:branched-chain amino acid transport system ATP-binding protein|nr:branched-chain amino acid transport system ATP-binding protein [Acidobacteriota bacterium]